MNIEYYWVVCFLRAFALKPAAVPSGGDIKIQAVMQWKRIMVAGEQFKGRKYSLYVQTSEQVKK